MAKVNFYQSGDAPCLRDTEGMEPKAYQNFCAVLLRREGFRELTRAGREAPAVDFYAEKDGERWAIRCRKPDAAQSDPEAAAGAGVPGRRSLIFSNRPFSEGVQRAAEQSNVTLWDSDRMETIIRVAFPEYSVDYYRAMQETGWKGSLKKDGKIALLYALLALIFYFIMFR